MCAVPHQQPAGRVVGGHGGEVVSGAQAGHPAMPHFALANGEHAGELLRGRLAGREELLELALQNASHRGLPPAPVVFEVGQ